MAGFFFLPKIFFGGGGGGTVGSDQSLTQFLSSDITPGNPGGSFRVLGTDRG